LHSPFQDIIYRMTLPFFCKKEIYFFEIPRHNLIPSERKYYKKVDHTCNEESKISTFLHLYASVGLFVNQIMIKYY